MGTGSDPCFRLRFWSPLVQVPTIPVAQVELPNRAGRRSRLIVCLLVFAILLSACAEESTGPGDDRRFANEEVTSIPTELPGEEPTVAVEAPTATSPGSGETLLSSENAPSTVVFREGDGLEIVSINQPMSSHAIVPGEGERIVDFAPSPDGARIAVLVVDGDESGLEPSLLLFDDMGAEQARWNLAEWVDSPAIATPDDKTSAEGTGSVSWSAGEEQILVTLFGKALLNVGAEVGVQEILVTSRAGTLLDAAWSPTGDQIALKTRNGSGSGTVWVFNPGIDGDSFKQVIPPAADASNLGSVTEVKWMADGQGLAYILAQDASESSPGGQLYSIDLATRERRVIATPGRGGPAAQITDFTVSPDGASIAYTIEEPDGAGWKFHSLWIRSIDSALFIDLPTASVDSATDYWWVGDGFAWRYVSGPNHGVAFLEAGADAGLLWAPSPPPEGTPGASPAAASSEGSPVAATPVIQAATPVLATPMATPAMPSAATPDGS